MEDCIASIDTSIINSQMVHVWTDWNIANYIQHHFFYCFGMNEVENINWMFYIQFMSLYYDFSD